jgi:FkbM family methyltransferase
MRHSYAQNGEDILLWRCFGELKSGFYIDVGASSPINDSVTQLFYENGWSGINIEPVAERVAELRQARPRDITILGAAGATSGQVTMHRTAGLGGLSSMTKADFMTDGNTWPMQCEQYRLDAVLERNAPGTIHFLKIDVEGAEAKVLQGLDLARWRPEVIVIEATTPMSATVNSAEWEGLMTGYECHWFDGVNKYYIANECREQHARHFGVQPNVFDGFERFAGKAHPLLNVSSADHLFARTLALVKLQAIGIETAEVLEDMYCLDMRPTILDEPVSGEHIQQFYWRIMARGPSSDETQGHLQGMTTGRQLVRQLIGCEEYRHKRTRVSLR